MSQQSVSFVLLSPWLSFLWHCNFPEPWELVLFPFVILLLFPWALRFLLCTCFVEINPSLRIFVLVWFYSGERSLVFVYLVLHLMPLLALVLLFLFLVSVYPTWDGSLLITNIWVVQVFPGPAVCKRFMLGRGQSCFGIAGVMTQECVWVLWTFTWLLIMIGRFAV